MQRALSTHLFVNQPLTPLLLERIENAGLPAVEIFCARQHFDYADPARARALARWFADHALELRSLHAPIYSDFEWGRRGPAAIVNIAEPDPLRRQASLDHIFRALEVAERLPFRFLVQHIGLAGERFDPRKLDTAYECLRVLLPFARARGVQILLENIPNELSTPARLLEFLRMTGLEELRLCFDTGHAHLTGSVPEDFEALHTLVVSTHVHDNNGRDDDHLFPFQGSIDWDATMAALAAAGPDVPLQLELRDYGEFPDPLAKALESFQRLEELVPAPQA